MSPIKNFRELRPQQEVWIVSLKFKVANPGRFIQVVRTRDGRVMGTFEFSRPSGGFKGAPEPPIEINEATLTSSPTRAKERDIYLRGGDTEPDFARLYPYEFPMTIVEPSAGRKKKKEVF